MTRIGSRGIALLLLVVIVAVAGAVLMSSTWLFANQMMQVQLRTGQVKARHLAQAGVMRAVYDWVTSDPDEADRTYSAIAETTVAGTNQFRTGVDADFAYYGFGSASWTTGTGNACDQSGPAGDAEGDECRRLAAFDIRNIRPGGGGDITVVSCRVSWTGSGGETVESISLNGTEVYSGSGANGALLDITDTDLSPGSSFNGSSTYIQWSASPNGSSDVGVTVQWVFSDDGAAVDSKSYPVVFWNDAATSRPTNGAPALRTFQVTSTGQIEETSLRGPSVVETVRAVVAGSAPVPEIIDWDELDNNLAIT